MNAELEEIDDLVDLFRHLEIVRFGIRSRSFNLGHFLIIYLTPNEAFLYSEPRPHPIKLVLEPHFNWEDFFRIWHPKAP